MRDHSFSTAVMIESTPDEVFDAINNVRGWWALGVEGATDKPGAEWTFWDEALFCQFRITEFVPSSRVAWHVVDTYNNSFEHKTEWKDTEVRFDISETDGGTLVRFTHSGLVPEFECYGACSSAWTFYVHDSLAGLVSTGAGQPISKPTIPPPTRPEDRI